MMMRSHVLLVLAAGLLLAADAPNDDAVKKEKAKLLGTWKVASLEANGQKVPEEFIKDLRLVFTADALTRMKGDKAESGAGYRLDPSKTPKWLDMTGKTDGKDRVIPAVYALEEDTLKLCFPADYKKDGKLVDSLKRPEKLDGGEGSGQALMILKREKP
jgi:uncharacterized protein (TIGR03067 family)